MASKIVKESLDRFFDYDLHIETRTIYLGDNEDEHGDVAGQVGPLMAERLIKTLILFNQTPEKPIKIILNTGGGYVTHGYAIYDAIKASPCHVTIEVMGQASSMGVIILQAADERIIHPNAILMAHNGTDSHNMADVINIEKWAEYSKKVDRPRMYEIFAEKSKRKASYWEHKCVHDFIMTAEQAVEEGLVDKIYDTKAE